MSNRTALANKAVELAWTRERERVMNGQGTRDWTQDQQKDIVERGKAYDENGKAFQGHHMKSVEKHSDDQGNPDNIQFVTIKEHLDAHGGNFQNPTNGYYDYITGETIEFADEVVPCTVINLSDPLYITYNDVQQLNEESTDKTINSDKSNVCSNAENQTDQSVEFKKDDDSIKNGATENVPKEKKRKILSKEDIDKAKKMYDKARSFYQKNKTKIDIAVTVLKEVVGPAIGEGIRASKEYKASTSSSVPDTAVFNLGNTVSNTTAEKTSLLDPIDGTTDSSSIKKTTCEELSDLPSSIENTVIESPNRDSTVEVPVSSYDRIRNGKKEHVKEHTRGGKKESE